MLAQLLQLLQSNNVRGMFAVWRQADKQCDYEYGGEFFEAFTYYYVGRLRTDVRTFTEFVEMLPRDLQIVQTLHEKTEALQALL